MKRMVMVLLALLPLAACGPARWESDLVYKPQDGVTVIGGADTVVVKVTTSDARTSDRDRISAVKGLYGNERAAIHAKQDVAQFVNQAIETELRARGFRLGSGSVFVLVDVNKFYADFKNARNVTLTSVGEAILNVQVMSAAGRLLYSRSYLGEYEQVSDLMMAHDQNVGRSLPGALSRAIEQMMGDQYFIQALVEAGRAP